MGWTHGWMFDLSRASHRESFSVFIEFVRRRLGVDGTVMQEARRLPPQEDAPVFQDLELSAPDRSGNLYTVALRLRTDNLYVVGFRNGDGNWFVFNDITITMVGARQLPFNGSYSGSNGIGPDRGAPNFVDIQLSVVEDAIHSLYSYSGEVANQGDLRDRLRTLIVTFIESARFTEIGDSVAAAMGDSRVSYTLSHNHHHVSLIHNWGSLSTALLQLVNTTNNEFPPSNFFERFVRAGLRNIHNTYGVAAALGLVLITAKHGRGGPRRQLRSANYADYDDVALGLTLVEVLRVVINNIDNENPGDLYGTVRVDDSFGSVKVFHRERSDVQSVGPGDQADLVWPDRAISAADDFVIDLDLKDRDTDLSPDDEVSRGQVVWISREAISSHCNVVRSNLVSGEYGSVTVYYAVVTNAVVATVEVLLVDGDGESVPDVYGVVTAMTEMAPGRSLDYDLFRRQRSEQVSVPANAYIPLKRSVITAALGSPFEVVANLWDKDTFPDLSPDDQIAHGSVTFNPQFHGKDRAEITGPNGKVDVHVTWSLTH